MPFPGAASISPAAAPAAAAVPTSTALLFPMYPTCCQCQEPFRQAEDEAALVRRLNPLTGDLFYKYTCSQCSPIGEAIFERLSLSWINVIRLVLFHLHQTDRQRVGFFRWKEDICQLIEERWETLLPLKSKTASWMNSVSSVLSANSSMFISGFEKLKQPGWWALRTVQPPRPPAYAGDSAGIGEGKRRKRRADEFEELMVTGSGDGKEKKLDLPIPRPASAHAPLSTSIRASLPMDTAQTLLLAKHYADRIPNVNALLPLEKEATPTTVRAAQEIKRKLVERLLRVDSKLLQEALVNAPPEGRFENAPVSANASIHFSNNMAAVSLARPLSTPPMSPSTSMGTTIPATHFSVAPQKSVTPSTPYGLIESKETKGPKLGGLPTRKELKRLQKMARPANYVRASPHENELLELSLRVMNPDATLARFKRKLIMRRAKRRAGLAIFDLDQIIYKYLKSSEPLLLRDLGDGEEHSGQASLPPMEGGETKTYYDVPFVRDPSLSFKAKLIGITNMKGYPAERISPFSGLRLPAFLHQESEIRPLRLRLLDEMNDKGLLSKSSGEGTSDYIGPSSTIDFTYVRKEFIPQVNRLLRKFFWPAIDMTETLDYPDYGIVVLYRKLVIGCAFMTPDAYITYFLIHPEWADAGLGSLLLYFLITKASPPHLDITLHVSATNPAMLLYQKFGFKPEEYIVNFYDKYYRDDENTIGQMASHSKNAFLIRLRR